MRAFRPGSLPTTPTPARPASPDPSAQPPRPSPEPVCAPGDPAAARPPGHPPRIDPRRAGAPALAGLLQAARAATLHQLAVGEAGLGPGLRVPQDPTLNLPLWEAGHIAWFADVWGARYPLDEARRGPAADPDAPRAPAATVGGGPAQADALYDSSRVPHAARWALPLPDAATTRSALARSLDATLVRLDRLAGASAGSTAAARTDPHAPDPAPDPELRARPADPALDDALYLPRLILLHELMHEEAGLILAQQLGLDRRDALPLPPAGAPPVGEIVLPGGPLELGATPGAAPGFAFDNELGRRRVDRPPTRIDTRAVRQGAYLAFVEAGGYDEPRLWTPAGWAWRQAQAAAGHTLPRDLRREPDGRWSRRVFDRWQDADPTAAMQQVSAHEAEAWCRWAGRRLPTEAEWVAAALGPQAARCPWGEVWEWTADAFLPFEGFRPHPYRDYSQPWFGDHRVLRGAAWSTPAGLRDARFRNFYLPGRNDLFAGFRSCAR